MPNWTITLLITGLGHGGAEKQLVQLAVLLKKRGWEVRVISMIPGDDAHFIHALADSNVPYDTLNMQRGKADIRALLRLTKLLRCSGPQVLLCYMFHAILLGSVAGWLAGVEFIIGSIRTEKFSKKRVLALRLANQFCTLTTTNSKTVASRLLREDIVCADKLLFIPNGLHVKDYQLDCSRKEVRKRLGIGDAEFLWLAVGRLEEAKDYPSLLDAFRRVLVRHPKAKLWIAGCGSLFKILNEKAIKLGLDDKVQLLGFRSDIPFLLRAADALVLSSAWEGSPNAIIEAFAAGVPVVSTCVGGVEELVCEGVSGFLVAPRDSRALAQTMLKMMGLDSRQRCSMGEEGRTRIVLTHDFDRVADEYEKLFFNLIQHNKV